MKLLLLGARGQVGTELARLGVAHDAEVVPLDLEELDIVDTAAVHATVECCQPDLVVNAAAYTAVDRAEAQPEQAYAANRDGPENLAAACARHGVPLIHFSTDYVFNGDSNEAYREDDPISPLGVYGQSKLEGERAVRRRCPRHLILRVSWVFGSHGSNFVKAILRRAQKDEVLRVVSDQRGCPTAAADIAEVVLQLAARVAPGRTAAWGTYHFCGTPPTTWYELAKAVLDEAGNYVPLTTRKVVPISTDQYPTRAPRPAHSVLDCTRLAETFGIGPRPWRTALKHVVKEICRD